MRKKSFFYVPGLISLIGLPILIFIFSPEDIERQVAFRLFLPSDDTVNSEIFSKASIVQSLKGKKIEQLFLDDYIYGDLYKNLFERKLCFVQDAMERLAFNNDTSRVLRITLGQDVTFEQFVSILNLATIYLFRRYAYIDNDFYFLANDPPVTYTNTLEPPLAVTYEPEDMPEYQGPGKWEIWWEETKYKIDEWKFYIERNIPLSIGFVTLIFIPFLLKLFRKKSPVASA